MMQVKAVRQAVFIVVLVITILLPLSNPAPALAQTEYPLLTRLTSEISTSSSGNIDRMTILNAWIYASLSVNSVPRDGNSSHFIDTEETLRLLDGICGHRAMLMEDIATYLGISWRETKFYNIPFQGSHVACEINISGNWYFYDPTLGLYFAEPSNPRNPLSLARARFLYPDILVMKAAIPGWQGGWKSTTALATALIQGTLYTQTNDSIIRDPKYNLPAADIVSTYIVSDSILDMNSDSLSSPFYIDLRNTSFGQLGNDDGAYSDLLGYAHEGPYGENYNPYLFVIGSDTPINLPNITHQYSFVTNSRGQLTLKFKLIDTVPNNYLKYFLAKLDYAMIDFSARRIPVVELNNQTLSVSFEVAPPVTAIELRLANSFASNHRFRLDYISWLNTATYPTDTTSPAVSITSPTNGQVCGTPTITVGGTALDDVGVSTVKVRVGYGGWKAATGTTLWNKEVTLNPGTNTIFVKATDTSQNTVETSTTVVYSPLQKLIGADDAACGGTLPGNYIGIMRFQAVESGTISSLRLKANTSGNVKVAIYADNAAVPGNEEPGNKLNSVDTSTAVSAGWNSIAIPATAVVKDSYYWLAFNSDAQLAGYNAGFPGKYWYRTAPYAVAFPDTLLGTSSSFNKPNMLGLMAGWGANVTQSLSIITASLPNGVIGASYSQTLQASEGTGSYSWSITAGSLPAGLSLNSATGAISGTPTMAGTFNFTVTAISGAGTVTKALSITVTGPVQKLIGADDAACTDLLPGNYMGIMRFQAVESANVTSLRLKANTSGNVKVAIYADNAGEPGNKLNSVDTSTAVSAGWNSITIPATAVVKDSYYWLAINADAALACRNSSLSGTYRYWEATYDGFTFPDTVGDTFTSSNALGMMAGWGPPAALAITTTALPAGVVGGRYSRTLQASGGTGIYSWSIAAGSLPTVLSLNSATGVISGTSAATGASNFTVQVTDGVTTVTKDFSITVNNPPPLSVMTTSLANGLFGTSYSQTVQAGGGTGSYSWSLTAGLLPAGLSLNSATGVISGTSAATGTSNFTVQVISGIVTVTKALSITVLEAPLSVTTTSLANGLFGVSYSQTVQASGGMGSYSWSITAGSLPAGLSLNSATGVISGTPTGTGTSNFTVQVISGAGTATKALSITVTGSVQKLIGADDAACGGTLPGNYIGIMRFQAVESGTISSLRLKANTSGNVKVAIYADNAAVPGNEEPGNKLNSVDTSTAVSAGWNSIAIPATAVVKDSYYWLAFNSDAQLAGYNASFPGKYWYRTALYTAAFPDTLLGTSSSFNKPNMLGLMAGWGAIAPGPLTITTASLPNGVIGFSYSQTLRASGGTGIYSWSITAGSLPAGLSLNSANGVISGTPTATGTSNFTVRVLSGAGTVTKALSIAVVTAPTQKLIGADDAPCAGTLPENFLGTMRFQAVQSGTISILRLKAYTSGNVKVAIYADNGVKLNSVDTSTAVSAGWNSIVIPSTPVVKDSYYWLAFNSDAQLAGYNSGITGSYKFRAEPYSGFAFPDTLGTGYTPIEMLGLMAGW